MELHNYLSEAIKQDPELPEKIYYHSGLKKVTRSLIDQWAEGLVVPSDEVQDRIIRFIESVGTVRMIRNTTPETLPDWLRR